MKKLLLLLPFLFFISCQSDDDSNTMLDNTLVGIEKITLNGKDYTLSTNSFMLDKEDCPLIVTGLLASSSRVELEYVWNVEGEDLSSVDIACKNPTAQVEIKNEINQAWKIYHITIITTEPQAEVVYTISSFLNK